eukprot:TRINITY_DN34787_c3_g1_i1.p1 TRINITY_DN34787_c3_g1~~TRINITY_DN34787_c3_g1_i1.p1  ORF type:complete len:114 (-),score=6.64 TRINITY_DN34787_c3_g1_i1:2823-3164(-)
MDFHKLLCSLSKNPWMKKCMPSPPIPEVIPIAFQDFSTHYLWIYLGYSHPVAMFCFLISTFHNLLIVTYGPPQNLLQSTYNKQPLDHRGTANYPYCFQLKSNAEASKIIIGWS